MPGRQKLQMTACHMGTAVKHPVPPV